MRDRNLLSGTCLPRLGSVLTLVSVLLSVVVAVPSAQAQNYKVVYAFQCGTDGANPYGGLVRDSAGNLYGTTVFGGVNGFGTVFEISTSGTESVLHSFAGAPTDGETPFAGLIRDAAGNLYGTTSGGGTDNEGTVFEVSASGTETVLYSFAGFPDGANPTAALGRDAVGNLYGTTYAGGTSGVGTAFALSPAGVESVLHSFESNTGDGTNPYGGLVQDAAGNLYGTTQFGGAFNEGTVFELSKGKKEAVLHSFAGSPGDGTEPVAGLLRDKAGNLYGTTSAGGFTNDEGVVFKLDPTGVETVLFGFDVFPGGANGGYHPGAGLVADAKGNLYGTTEVGGASLCPPGNGCGVVFRVSPTGQETVLHSFSGPSKDGEDPLGGLISDNAGNIYGTTRLGGTNSCGIVFKLGH